MFIYFLLARPLRIDKLPNFHRLLADLARPALNLAIHIPNAIVALFLILLIFGSYSSLPVG